MAEESFRINGWPIWKAPQNASEVIEAISESEKQVKANSGKNEKINLKDTARG